ncbi:MAG: transcriptional regulator VisR [Allorhizobium sp.]
MASSRDPSDFGSDPHSPPPVRAVQSRSDLFSKLSLIQKSINARSFAILAVRGTGMPSKRRLESEIENWGATSNAGCAPFIAAYGETLLAHMDTSLLPLIWNAKDDSSFADASDFSPFVVRLKLRTLPYSGIAFPCRLGTVGNGVIVYATPGGMDLPGVQILDVHGRCNKIMMDLLSIVDRRTVPAEALSEREITCLQLAGDGCISEEIADKLGLSVHTVNAYLGSATIKLDSVNRIQAIAKAIRLGYIN